MRGIRQNGGFQTFDNYVNVAQKSAQRTFWKTGSQLILRDYYGYETAAWLLEHSLHNSPNDVYRDSTSRIAGLISNSNALNNLIDKSIANSNDGTFSFTGSAAFSDGELFYSINKANVKYSGVRQSDGSWLITGTVTDTYDYTEIVSMMNSDGAYEFKITLGTAANDAAVISQKTGAIKSYNITVDFVVRR